MTKIADILFGCELREGELAEFPALLTSRFPFGKFLVLTGEESALALGNALKKIPKKILLVLARGDDLLPLFGLPDRDYLRRGRGRGGGRGEIFRGGALAAVCRGVSFLRAAGAAARQGYGTRWGKRNDVSRTSARFRFCRSVRHADGRAGYGAGGLLFVGVRAFPSFPSALRAAFPALCGRAKTIWRVTFPPRRNSPFPSILPIGEGRRKPIFRAVSAAEYCFRSGFPEGEIFRLIEAAKGARRRDKGRKRGKRACVFPACFPF